MSAEFNIGDTVLCIEPSPLKWAKSNPKEALFEDRLYTIEEVDTTRLAHSVLIRVKELSLHVFWDSERFILIEKLSKEELIPLLLRLRGKEGV